MRPSMTLIGAAAVVVTIASLTAITPAYTATVFSDSLVIFFHGNMVSNGGGPTFGWNVFESENDEPSTFHFSSVPFDPALGARIPTQLVEPSDFTVSDAFGVFDLGGQGNPHLGFISNVPTDFPFAGGLRLLELCGFDACSFDATVYLAPDLRAQGYTALFTSDVDAVPLPAAFPLFASGLG